MFRKIQNENDEAGSRSRVKKLGESDQMLPVACLRRGRCVRPESAPTKITIWERDKAATCWSVFPGSESHPNILGLLLSPTWECPSIRWPCDKTISDLLLGYGTAIGKRFHVEHNDWADRARPREPEEKIRRDSSLCMRRTALLSTLKSHSLYIPNI